MFPLKAWKQLVLRATGCSRFPRLRSMRSPTNILFAMKECTVCGEHATKSDAFTHKRAFSPRFPSSGRQPLAPLPTCRPGMCRARLGDFRRPRIRASTALFSLSLSLPLSPFERARLVDASRVGCCETGSVLHEIEIPARVPRLINVRRSMGPVALGVAEDTCHRHGILSPPSAKNSGISG